MFLGRRVRVGRNGLVKSFCKFAEDVQHGAFIVLVISICAAFFQKVFYEIVG